MNKHTPGPWILDSPDCDPTIDDSSGNCVISGNRDGGLYAPVLADLVLATAAPDLLEALENAQALRPCEMYAAAIARARGEA